MINFMLSWVEHEKSFITSGPGLQIMRSNWNHNEGMRCLFIYLFFKEKKSVYAGKLNLFLKWMTLELYRQYHFQFDWPILVLK